MISNTVDLRNVYHALFKATPLAYLLLSLQTQKGPLTYSMVQSP